MINSNLMAPEVAYYTFGVDALEFWTKEPKLHDNPSFELFYSFVEGVRQFQKRFPNGPDQVADFKY
jgi:hypothetical protein